MKASQCLVVLLSAATSVEVKGFLHPKIAKKCNVVPLMSTKGEKPKEAPGSEQQSSIAPYFRIRNWALADPIMKDFDRIAERLEMPMAGWSTEGDNVVFKSSFMSPSKQMSSFLNEFEQLIDRMQEEAAQLERLEIHGEKDELKKTETTSKSIKPYTEYFEAEEGYFSNLKKGGVPKTAVSVHTYFDVVDPETQVKARSIMKKIIDEAKHEGAGCIYFGWHRDGRKMVLRGTFHDAQAASNHFKKIEPLMEHLLEEPEEPARLTSVEIHGNKDELKKTDKLAEKLRTGFNNPEIHKYQNVMV